MDDVSAAHHDDKVAFERTTWFASSAARAWLMLLALLAARAAGRRDYPSRHFRWHSSSAPWAVRRRRNGKCPLTHPGAWSPQSPARSARDGRCHPGTSPERSAQGRSRQACDSTRLVHDDLPPSASSSTWPRDSSERAVFAPTAILLFVLVVTVMIGSAALSSGTGHGSRTDPCVRAWLSWLGLAPVAQWIEQRFPKPRAHV